ncbi:hypothetical protein [Halovulum marinum]|uniref:hypothetical protein n=1 Tax=Halovulum marinum TaxID=2662447 RepID=UPI0012B23613|nr:hypothetical protein [Halovulum marinum]
MIEKQTIEPRQTDELDAALDRQLRAIQNETVPERLTDLALELQRLLRLRASSPIK